MPNIIYKVKNYTNEDVIENLVNYIIRSDYCESIGYSGCFLYHNQDYAEGIANSFNAVKNVYYKNDRQLVQHIIIGFGDVKDITEYEVEQIAGMIAAHFFLEGFQSFWGIHFGSDEEKSYRHIHIVVNTINGMTGMRYISSYENMGALKKFLENHYQYIKWQYYQKESFYHEVY